MARRICIDGLFLSKAYAGAGANRYLVNLLRAMPSVTAETKALRIVLLVPSLAEMEGSMIRNGEGLESVCCSAMRWGKPWRMGWVTLAARRLKPDILFLPFPAFVPFKPAPLAVTIHDIIPLLFPSQYNHLRDRLYRLSYTSSLRKADLVFTDSEHSKGDIVSTLHLRPEKVVVAHLGFDSDLFRPGPSKSPESEAVLSRYGITRPYILHVGTMEPRKNLVRLVQAYRLLVDRGKDFPFHLVLCGPVGWGCEPLLELVQQPALRGRVILPGLVSDDDLAEFYRGAACFVMPSLYEGFGLPLLEAMASGVPTLSANRSSLPEVGGDATLYFDPESVEELAATLEEILSKSVLQQHLVQRGLERARQFSWERCAKTTFAALGAL